jgi:hypothetical protein
MRGVYVIKEERERLVCVGVIEEERERECGVNGWEECMRGVDEE